MDDAFADALELEAAALAAGVEDTAPEDGIGAEALVVPMEAPECVSSLEESWENWLRSGQVVAEARHRRRYARMSPVERDAMAVRLTQETEAARSIGKAVTPASIRPRASAALTALIPALVPLTAIIAASLHSATAVLAAAITLLVVLIVIFLPLGLQVRRQQVDVTQRHVTHTRVRGSTRYLVEECRAVLLVTMGEFNPYRPDMRRRDTIVLGHEGAALFRPTGPVWDHAAAEELSQALGLPLTVMANGEAVPTSLAGIVWPDSVSTFERRPGYWTAWMYAGYAALVVAGFAVAGL